MEFKNHIKKAAVLSLAVGSLAVAGLGFAGTASADDGANQSPPAWAWPVEPVRPAVNPQVVYPQQNAYYYGGYYYYANGPAYNNVVYRNAYLYNYNYTYANNAAVQTQRTLIAAASEVLGVPVQTVTAELSTGKSLTTIAAQRGWARQNFLNGVINRVQVKVAYGTVTPVIGNALISNLVNQSASVIDVTGTQTLLGMAPATFY